MTIPSITSLPTAPTRADSATFDTRADAFMTALPTMVTETNAAIAGINSTATQVTADKAATQAIKAAAVSDTQAIKDDAVSETQAIRNAASASAAQAAVYAANAASSAHFVGMWADLSGPLARPAGVSHNGKLWLLTVDLANVALSEPGVSDDWFSPGGSVEHCTYNNRASLRSLAPSENALYIVDHLGLFRFAEGSDEPDDDETCFRTSTGAWVLDAPHFDVSTAMLAPDELNQDERLDDAEARLDDAEARLDDAEARLDDAEARLDDAEANGSTLRASALCSITSINTLTQASFTASVPGAAVGDVSVACPAGALDPRVSVFARVTATDTVTVYINNPSASTATLTAGTWAIFVHKGA